MCEMSESVCVCVRAHTHTPYSTGHFRDGYTLSSIVQWAGEQEKVSYVVHAIDQPTEDVPFVPVMITLQGDERR